MFVQMRSPFSGQWLKIDAKDGSIIEFAGVTWQDVPHLPAIGVPSASIPPPPLYSALPSLPCGGRTSAGNRFGLVG
jgi:hypothetical protein